VFLVTLPRRQALVAGSGGPVSSMPFVAAALLLFLSPSRGGTLFLSSGPPGKPFPDYTGGGGGSATNF
jgi:hypothetical protein